MFHVGLCNLDFFLFLTPLCMCVEGGGMPFYVCQHLCLKMVCIHMPVHVRKIMF